VNSEYVCVGVGKSCFGAVIVCCFYFVARLIL